MSIRSNCMPFNKQICQEKKYRLSFAITHILIIIIINLWHKTCPQKNMKNIFVLSIFFLAVIFSSCKKNNSAGDSMNGPYKMSVYLTDDPTKYDKIYLDIKSVQIKKDNDDSENGWQTIHITRTGVFNLLKFTNGADTILATDAIASSKVSQVRVILGTNNSVVIKGVSYPLETPSAQESGLKINIDADLVAGIEYKIWLDFDAARSIVTTGNGKYILKPVIRAFVKSFSGSVKGIVLPLNINATVYAINNSDTVASAMPDTLTGAFLIPGLRQGNYMISVNSNSYVNATYNNVSVTNENVTDIGTVQLHQ
jgi:hypothetical protein